MKKTGQKKARRRQFKITARRQRVMELYLANKTQREIAAIEGVDQKTICRDIAIVEDWLKERAIADADKRLHRKLFKLDRLVREAEAAWDKSKEDKVVSQTEQEGPGTVVEGKPVITKYRARQERVGQAGDPRMLQVALAALQEESKILGHHKPFKVAPTNPDGDKPAPATGVMVFHVGGSDSPADGE